MEPRHERIANLLRAYAGDYATIAHQLARWLGLHSTDAVAFTHIVTADDEGTPLTPARLAERISLTSGATSTLIDRLEQRGCVRRARSQSDRRVVTLHSVPEMHERADEFFVMLGADVGRVFASYDDDTLAAVERFLTDVRGATARFAADPPTRD